MKISEPDRDAVLEVALGIRDRDVAEFLAISPLETRDQLAASLVTRYATSTDVFVASQHGVNIAAGAMVQHRPHVVTLMFFATDRFPEIATALTKFIRQRLFPRYRASGVHRIECVSIDGYDEVHRWIELLGLKREAIMPGYGKNGETFVQFAWAADAPEESQAL